MKGMLTIVRKLLLLLIIYSLSNAEAYREIIMRDDPVQRIGSDDDTDSSKGDKELLTEKIGSDLDTSISSKSDEEAGAGAGQEERQKLVLPFVPITNDEMGSRIAKYGEGVLHPPMGKISTLWPLGVVSYRIDPQSFPGGDDSITSRIRDTMAYIESNSCIQFRSVKVTEKMEHKWLDITNPIRMRPCSHQAKLTDNNAVTIVLGLDCLSRANILHTLLHGIGFRDEVSHPQRDQYVRVQWNNIKPSFRHLFVAVPDNTKVLVEYDPMSIMHFHDRAFSKNGKATIAPLIPGLQIEPSDRLSQLDIKRLHMAFDHECKRRRADNLLDTCHRVMKYEDQPRGLIEQDRLTSQEHYSSDGIGTSSESSDGMMKRAGKNKNTKNKTSVVSIRHNVRGKRNNTKLKSLNKLKINKIINATLNKNDQLAKGVRKNRTDGKLNYVKQNEYMIV